MLKIKKVYICDHCNAVALPELYLIDGVDDIQRGMPEGWENLGSSMHLCPICSETYKKFKSEVIKERNKK